MPNQEQKEIASALSPDFSKAIVIGDRTYFSPLHIDGRPFYFNPPQTKFLYALQKFDGDISRACAMVGKDVEWADKFLSSRKFSEYRELLTASASIKNGSLRNWWWQTVFDGARGYKEWYEATCELCHEDYKLPVAQAEQFRNDDMKFELPCRLCKNLLQLEHKTEEFKPTREQIQCVAEIGARVEPRVERVAHEFTAENFVFVPEQ